MQSRDFCYWLQGFFEVSKAEEVTKEQVEIIKRHLNMVFTHEIDPSFGGPAQQQELSDIHQGVTTYSYRGIGGGTTTIDDSTPITYTGKLPIANC